MGAAFSEGLAIYFHGTISTLIKPLKATSLSEIEMFLWYNTGVCVCLRCITSIRKTHILCASSINQV